LFHRKQTRDKGGGKKLFNAMINYATFNRIVSFALSHAHRQGQSDTKINRATERGLEEGKEETETDRD